MRLAILAAAVAALFACNQLATAQVKYQTNKLKTGNTLTLEKAPKGGVTSGVTGATTGTFVALTAAECTELGGTVYDTDNLCKSGKYCGRTDEHGNRNRVCLEAAE